MRTDVKVDITSAIRCPQIPISSPGRPTSVKRGDWIEWNWADFENSVGRVIGSVVNPDDIKVYLVVNLLMLGGQVCERWVLPEDVTNTSRHTDKVGEWLFSDDWMKCSPDTQRSVFDNGVQ